MVTDGFYKKRNYGKYGKNRNKASCRTKTSMNV